MSPSAMLASLLLGGALSVPATASVAAARSPQRCAIAIRHAIRTGQAAAVPAGCWQVGPLRLGMRTAEVAQRLGKPVASAAVPSATLGQSPAGRVTLYAFQNTPGPLVRRGRASFRLAELRFADDRLVAIDNEPGARIDGGRCRAGSRRLNDVQTDARTGPLLRFQQVGVGDPLTLLARRFGRLPAGNRSHDVYSYQPVPISFGGDPDRSTITGFAVATDAAALMATTMPRLRLRRDPVTCALTAVAFALQPAT